MVNLASRSPIRAAEGTRTGSRASLSVGFTATTNTCTRHLLMKVFRKGKQSVYGLKEMPGTFSRTSDPCIIGINGSAFLNLILRSQEKYGPETCWDNTCSNALWGWSNINTSKTMGGGGYTEEHGVSEIALWNGSPFYTVVSLEHVLDFLNCVQMTYKSLCWQYM